MASLLPANAVSLLRGMRRPRLPLASGAENGSMA